MSTFVPLDTHCVHCERPFTASVAKSLQVRRGPSLRDAALRGTLNRVICPHCSRAMSIEPSLLYMDLDRSQMIAVVPTRAQLNAETLTLRVDEIFRYNLDHAAPPMVRSWDLVRRVVFGLDGLAELLRILDADLDDYLMAALKLKISAPLDVDEIVRTRFERFDGENLVFSRMAAPAADGTAVRFELDVPFSAYYQLVQRGPEYRDALVRAAWPNCSDLTSAFFAQSPLDLDDAPPVGANPDVVRRWVARRATDA